VRSPAVSLITADRATEPTMNCSPLPPLLFAQRIHPILPWGASTGAPILVVPKFTFRSLEIDTKVRSTTHWHCRTTNSLGGNGSSQATTTPSCDHHSAQATSKLFAAGLRGRSTSSIRASSPPSLSPIFSLVAGAHPRRSSWPTGKQPRRRSAEDLASGEPADARARLHAASPRCRPYAKF
jgi:hypothetical protein